MIPSVQCINHHINEYDDENDLVTINFSNLSLRRVPTKIMFYTRTKSVSDYLSYEEEIRYTDKAASIVKVKLRTDLSSSNLVINDRHTIDIITSDTFDEYIPPIGLTGNCLALPWNKLPRRKNTTADYDNLHGQLTIAQDWIVNLSVDVFVTFFYQDSYFDIDKNYQTSKIALDRVL